MGARDIRDDAGWLAAAADLIMVPGFHRAVNGQLTYGSWNMGWQYPNPAALDAMRLSSHELMTLREIDPAVYRRLIAGQPRARILSTARAMRVQIG